MDKEYQNFLSELDGSKQFEEQNRPPAATGAAEGGARAGPRDTSGPARGPPPPPDMTKLHFGGLPYALRHEDLMQLLQPYAPVYHCELKYERDTGRPRGFAFVILGREKAEEAGKALDQQMAFGRMLQVTVATNQRHDRDLNGGQPPAGPPRRGMPLSLIHISEPTRPY